MKFRLVFETTSKHGHPVQLKFNVPPSKHQGLVNFMNIAVEEGNPVDFTVEKVDKSKHELSKIRGTFKLEPLTEDN